MEEYYTCECGKAAVEKTVKKRGNNTGREFLCCPKGSELYGGCGYFIWSDEIPTLPQGSSLLPTLEALASRVSRLEDIIRRLEFQ